jgi:hypothetical protein
MCLEKQNKNPHYCPKCLSKNIKSLLMKGIILVGEIELYCRKCKNTTTIVAQAK